MRANQLFEAATSVKSFTLHRFVSASLDPKETVPRTTCLLERYMKRIVANDIVHRC
jgi:hypothetical protein